MHLVSKWVDKSDIDYKTVCLLHEMDSLDVLRSWLSLKVAEKP